MPSGCIPKVIGGFNGYAWVPMSIWTWYGYGYGYGYDMDMDMIWYGYDPSRGFS